jgi:hypothetical protein
VRLSDHNWRQLASAPVAVICLGVSTCSACQAWDEELEELLADRGGWSQVVFGKALLDGGGLEDFKTSNEWLDLVPGLPFTAIFVEGRPATSFVGGGVHRLERRVERILAEQSRADVEASASDRASRQQQDVNTSPGGTHV